MAESAPRAGPLARLTRRLGLDRNPLRRRSDRAETFIMAALLALFLIGAPVAAFTASHLAHAATLRAQHAQQGSRRVPAVLLKAAPESGGFMYQSATYTWARARWTAPDGSLHVGEVPAQTGLPAGSTVRVWVDRSGQVTTPPLTATQIIDREVASVIVAPMALAVVLVSVAALARRLLEHRRLVRWGAAWEAVEPQWSQRP